MVQTSRQFNILCGGSTAVHGSLAFTNKMLHAHTTILYYLLTAALFNIPASFAKPRPVTTLPESNPIAMALADGGYVGGNRSSHHRGGYSTAGNATIEDMSRKSSNASNKSQDANISSSPASPTDADVRDGPVSPLSQGGYSAQNIAEALEATRKQPH